MSELRTNPPEQQDIDGLAWLLSQLLEKQLRTNELLIDILEQLKQINRRQRAKDIEISLAT